MLAALKCRYFYRAFFSAVPIGALAGAIGLGGGEFRLPVLTHFIGFSARAAIPLNLLISLVTLFCAAVCRTQFVPLASVLPHLPELIGLTVGGMFSAIHGVRFVMRMSDQRLVNALAALLAALGVLLLVEAFVPFSGVLLSGESGMLVRALVATFLGLGVGVVSSMLGVAGGELLIPALMFVFGAEITTAGTCSLLISLAIVSTGLWRYYRARAIPTNGGAQWIVGAMSGGSLLGACLGVFALTLVSGAFLKFLLGCVLIAAAMKTAVLQPRAANR